MSIINSDIEILMQHMHDMNEIKDLLKDRLFIDINDLQKAEQLKYAIENETLRDYFSWEILRIIAEYPANIETDKDKAKDILNRLAKLFGVEKTTQTGWFTHISGQNNAMIMLTLRDEDGWYNFMATDKYIMAEKSKPSTKHIIGLYGAKETGKTPTARKVFHSLKNSYPNHAILFNDENNYDVKGLFFIGNAMVCVDSQGDPTGLQMESLNDFDSIGCNVSFVCSRTDGRTVDAIEKFYHNYNIKWVERQIENDKQKQDGVNTKQAEDIVELIKQYSSIV